MRLKSGDAEERPQEAGDEVNRLTAAVIGAYKGASVGEARLDFLVDQRLLVELKTVDRLAPIHLAQVLAYPKGTGLTLGLLINFNVPSLRYAIRRVVRR